MNVALIPAPTLADTFIPHRSSILDQAVMSGDAEYTMRLLTRALALTPDPATADMLLDRGFNRATDTQRLEIIADFLRAECFAAIERGSQTVAGADPISTVGTRD